MGRGRDAADFEAGKPVKGKAKFFERAGERFLCA